MKKRIDCFVVQVCDFKPKVLIKGEYLTNYKKLFKRKLIVFL